MLSHLLKKQFSLLNKRTPINGQISNKINAAAMDLFPTLMIGSNLCSADFDNQTPKYKKFVKQFASFLKSESEFHSDVIEELFEQNEQIYK